MRIGVTLVVVLSVLSSCRDEEPATCSIAGVSVAADAVDPNGCQVCKPDLSRTEWSPLADATSCGAAKFCSAGRCVEGCVIAGATVAPDALNPANACTSCQPSLSATAYSPRVDGSACGTAQICLASQCTSACFINAAVVAADAVDTANACASCQPSLSTAAYSPRALGTACGAGQFCSGAQCMPGCFIDGAIVAADALDPTNNCASCQPLLSSTTYSPRAEASACGTGQFCAGNQCTAGCVINGSFVVEGAGDPLTPCLVCRSSVSTTTYSQRDDGVSCGAGARICVSGACFEGCLINGAPVAIDALNPSNACERCDPTLSTTAYTVAADGASCGAGLLCNLGQCNAQCFISGVFVDAGVQTTNRCRVCAPLANTQNYSAVAAGTSCTACNSCDGLGNCVPTVLEGNAVAVNDLPNSLLLSGDDLYYANNRRDPCCRSEVRRTSRDGGTAQVLAAGLYGPTAMTMMNGELFVADVQSGNIVRISTDGGLAPDGGRWTTIATLYAPSSITNDGTNVIYGGFEGVVSPNSLRSVRRDGSAPFTYSPALPTALATSGGQLYWGSANGTISRAPVGSTSTTVIASGVGRAGMLTFQGNSLIFGADGGVLRLPLSGGPAVALTTGQNDPLGVVSDGQHVYFTNYARGTANVAVDGINRVPLDGGPAVVLYRGEPGISLAVDNQCVYYTTYNSTFGVRRTDK